MKRLNTFELELNDWRNKNNTQQITYTYQKESSPYLVYGFRPIFCFLAPYIVISIILWSLTFAGYISLPFMERYFKLAYVWNDIWIGSAELWLFSNGSSWIISRNYSSCWEKLCFITLLWFAGRVGFWFIDYLGIYLVGF